MRIIIDNKGCDKCGCCVAICPHLAIDISQDLVEIDQEKCIRCQKCISSCPMGAIVNVSD